MQSIKFKNRLASGLKQIKKSGADATALESAIENLEVTELEDFNDDDKLVIKTVQSASPYVDMLPKFTGINPAFIKGASEVYRMTTSLVSIIADDESLIAIADELKALCKIEVNKVADQNQDAGAFGLNYLEYYNNLD